MMTHSAVRTGRVVSLAVVVTVSLLVMAVPSHAGERTESTGVTPTDTDYAATLQVPQFDQTAGALRSVRIELAASLTGEVMVENISASSATRGSAVLTGEITATAAADPGLVVTTALPMATDPFALESFDGLLDYAGASGITRDDLASANSAVIEVTAPEDLIAFIGMGTVAFDVVARATTEAAATGGNIDFLFDTIAGADMLVSYQFDEPAIDIQKTPDLQTVALGAGVSFTIAVTNTGDAALTNVVVTDAQAPGCERAVGDLPVGQTVTYDCAVTDVFEDFTNLAVATGEDSVGNVVTDEDDAFVNVIAPQIQIEKTPDTQTIGVGADASFDITVTNVGDTDLVNVVVTDQLVPACDAALGALAVGESSSYDCVAEGVRTDFTNVAEVADEDAEGNRVTDEDDAVVNVLAPEIDIAKLPGDQTIVVGRDAGFTIQVTNIGDVDLVNVVIADPRTPSCDRTIDAMEMGETVAYECMAQAVIEPFTNVVTVVAEDEDGNEVSDTAEAIVRVREPSTGQPELPATGSDSVELTLTGLLMIGLGAVLIRFEGRQAPPASRRRDL